MNLSRVWLTAMTAIALVSPLFGCATPRAGVAGGDAAAAFHCRSTATRFGMAPMESPPRLPPSTDGAIGRLEIKTLDGPAKPQGAGQYGSGLGELATRRVSVIAESVPLGQVAVALADALGVNVFVEPAVAPVRVFVHAPDTTVGLVAEVLEDQADLRIRCCLESRCKAHGNDLFFESETTLMARRAAFSDGPPLRVRVIELPPQISPTEFASTYCSLFGTSQGEAAVMGQKVVLKDSLDGLARGETLARKLQGLPVEAAEDPEVE